MAISSSQNNIETKNILTDEKHYEDLVIFSTKFDYGKLMTMLSLYYHELKKRLNSMKEKKCLMVNDYVPYKVLDRVKKKKDIEEVGNTKVLIATDGVLPDDIYFKMLLY